MNTNALKKFAQEARRKLLEQVGAKLEYVLNTDTPELREKTNQVHKLREAIQRSSKEQVIDKVTYTWFNRFMALRFMDANDYQPIGIRVLTPKEGQTLPELLAEAKQGHIPEELSVKNQRIYDLLDGKIPSANAQNEAYKELLIGACNHLNKVFPFLFERINDYTELLLPDDLTSELSIIQDIRDGMSVEDCAEVEVIGWLYQFYISERKDELINAKKVYKADEIAPVTQLFTPKWIVEYMVDNTLGQYWKEARPNTNILKNLQFYIKPNNPELIPSRDVKSPEDIKFFDPCVGSAHVLCYAFDIFYKIYEEEGYDPTTIPELIISKNLYGIDIDDRASQLAGFALMMKGRKHSRRFFKKEVILNITSFQNIESHPKFKNAKVLGSLIKISQEEVDEIEVDETSLFVERDLQLKKQASLLTEKYDIVVTNPPYLNSAYMEGTLKQFVEKEYKETKSDLFACFVVQCLNFTKESGLTAFVTPFVWLFIKSYEELRTYLINEKYLTNLIRPSYTSFFDSAIVPLVTFQIRNVKCFGDSAFFDLGYLGSGKEQPVRLKKALDDENDINVDGKKSKYIRNQKNFSKIPGSPIGYVLPNTVLDLFQGETISNYANPRVGLVTGDSQRFLRYWNEIDLSKSNIYNGNKWFKYQKGGSVRKWYGNNEYLINWENSGNECINDNLTASGRVKSHNYNGKHAFKKGVTWTKITSSGSSFRFVDEGFMFDDAGPLCSIDDSGKINQILCFLNSKIANYFLETLSPTLNLLPGHINLLPLINSDKVDWDIADTLIQFSKEEWDSNETSWDFNQNELIRIKGQDLEETYDLFEHYWKNKFFQLHKNEEELNRQFIEIYGLHEELTPDVPLEGITILKEETFIENGQLVFKATEVFAQFMSYAVGCMFGRYSLDKDGLILANQGETLEHYLEKVALTKDKLSFTPDDDNIIPVLDDEWFEDDIVGRFYMFLKASFGTANFDKNLAFVEECLGAAIRKYFVKDFYADHIKRYKKRPIYWMFSSPKGSFNVLIYMHRYTPDTLNKILNGYLIEYREKLNTRMEHLDHLIESGTSNEQTKAAKEKDKLRVIILELQEYEREIIRPLAIERINIDLDDGVLVNYNKFGKAIKDVAGLNDKVTKKKVLEFDWINKEEIQ